MTPAVVVTSLSKQFRRHHPHRPWTVQEALARGLGRLRSVERFWALQDVSLRVEPGRSLGVIGANGSGKSTLLRLIGGVGRADTGRIEIGGRLGALLDLGVGFHSDLTGRENTVMAGILAGLTRRQVLQRFDSIVAFAELEPFIDNPVRTYSTGMRMRLAFSAAMHSDSQVLLIDEVLSVGDLAFQRKCLERLTQFQADGGTILLVSHQAAIVRQMCGEALWLDGGRVMEEGLSTDVVQRYLAHMAAGNRLAQLASD